jgi:hypothetical protein
LLQLGHEWRRLAMQGDMLDPGAMARQQFPIKEGLQTSSPLLRSGGQIEIHEASLFPSDLNSYQNELQICFDILTKFE